MHCPVCQTSPLKRTRLEDYLSAHHCEDCSGHWISSYDYWHWLEWQVEDTDVHLPENFEAINRRLEAFDNRKASICPDCHHLMRKAPVGKGLRFYLDRCSHCGGVWLDQDEWATLADCNLHNKIHLIFSESWQAEIRHQKFQDVLEETYRDALGDDLYTETMRIKDWLDHHPQKDYILSLLNQQMLKDDQSLSEKTVEPIHYTSRSQANLEDYSDGIVNYSKSNYEKPSASHCEGKSQSNGHHHHSQIN